MQLLSSIFGLFSPWLWLLGLVVLVAFIGSKAGVKVLADLWMEIVAVATQLWGQFKDNVLVLAIAGILFLFDQRLLVITLAIVAVVIAAGDKINAIVKTIKLPKV